MIRLLIIIVFILIFAIYTFVEGIVYFFVNLVNKDKAKKITYKTVRIVLSVIGFLAGIKIHMKGKENIISNEPVLIVSNHRGFFDIISGYPFLKGSVAVVAKDSFKGIPVIAYWMKRMGCFFLDRKNLRSGVAMIIDSVTKLKNGVSIWIFPEGTRNRNNDPLEPLPFKAGAFKIVEKCDVKILPVAFCGTDEVYEKQMPFIKSVDVKINIGKAFKFSELSENDRKNIGEYARGKIIDLLKEVIDG